MSGEEHPKGKISEYEKQRFLRIAENNARLEALGISKSAKALLCSRKRTVKPNSDDDYIPASASDESEEEFLGNSSSVTTERNLKNKAVFLSKKKLNRSEDDDDLDKAIALSLQDSEAGGSASAPSKKDAGSRKKIKPELMSKMQMTEDELVIYFYQFDEVGKGFITLRDVVKMATVHDFTWTQDELQDMIRCYDIDKDGKLSLDDFRNIVTRCRMFKDS